LTDGEEIVTEGAFSVDAAAQLEGKPSMMNPLGGMVSIGHNHNSGEAVSEEEHSSYQNQQSSETEVHEMLKVAGNCDLCKERIETAAKSVAGVTKAEWRAETQQLHLSFLSSKTTVDQVAKAIAAVGHDTEKFKASDSVYKTLPECCLYNRLK